MTPSHALEIHQAGERPELQSEHRTSFPGMANPPVWPWILVLGTWFALAAIAAASGVMKPAPGAPPAIMLGMILVPVLAAWLLWRVSPALRRAVLGLDLGLLTAMQGWRVIGAVFLVAFAAGNLPGVFAFPAGIGDIAVGVAAPFVAFKVTSRRAGWGASARWLIAAGLADFVVAITIGTMTGDSMLGVLRGPVSAGALQELPLALIPGFLVPVFILLHLAALAKLREMETGAAR